MQVASATELAVRRRLVPVDPVPAVGAPRGLLPAGEGFGARPGEGVVREARVGPALEAREGPAPLAREGPAHAAREGQRLGGERPPGHGCPDGDREAVPPPGWLGVVG